MGSFAELRPTASTTPSATTTGASTSVGEIATGDVQSRLGDQRADRLDVDTAG
jgi:hypothetical protein